MVAAAVQETVLLAEGAIKLNSISDETGSLSGGCVFLNTVQSVHGLYTSFAFYRWLGQELCFCQRERVQVHYLPLSCERRVAGGMPKGVS